MAPSHVRILEVFPPHEPRSSRREEGHFSNAEVRNAELSQSLLTSAATVQGSMREIFRGNFSPLSRCLHPDASPIRWHRGTEGEGEPSAALSPCERHGRACALWSEPQSTVGCDRAGEFSSAAAALSLSLGERAGVRASVPLTFFLLGSRGLGVVRQRLPSMKSFRVLPELESHSRERSRSFMLRS